MSPYYKLSASGRSADLPPARDWCGVFFALHEKPPRQTRWIERAYAYNLYEGGQWSEPNAPPQVSVGGSHFAASHGNGAGMTWRMKINERGLWRGDVVADLTFTQIPTRFPAPCTPSSSAENDHTWVCAAPLCDMEAAVTLSPSQTVSFAGNGYHDHNFGTLPLQSTDVWYWGRAPLHCDDDKIRQAVFYHVVNKPAFGEEYPEPQTTWLAFEEADGTPEPPPVRENTPLLTGPTRNPFGLKHYDRVLLAHNVRSDNEQWRVALRPEWGAFSEGPFYRRLPITVSAQQKTVGRTAWTGKGEGIGEVFRPSRMLGPIASRAMWSRLRKRRV